MKITNSKDINIKLSKKANPTKLYKQNLIKNFISSFLHYIQTQQKEIIRMIQKNGKIDPQIAKQFKLKKFLKKNHPKKNRLYSILQLKRLFLNNHHQQQVEQQQEYKPSIFEEKMKYPQLQDTLQPFSLIKKSEIKAENDTEKICKFRPISSNFLHYKNYMDNQLKEKKNLQSYNCRISQNGISEDQSNTSIIVIQDNLCNQLSTKQRQNSSIYIQQETNSNIEEQESPIQQRNQDEFIYSSKQSSLTQLFNDQNDSKSSVQFDKYSSSSTKDLIRDQNQAERLHHNQETFSNQLKVTKNDQNFFVSKSKSKEQKQEINNQNQNKQTSLMTEIQNQIKQESSQTIQNINDLEKLILRVFALRFIRRDMYQYMMIYSKSQNPFSNFKYRQVELTNRIIKIEK